MPAESTTELNLLEISDARVDLVTAGDQDEALAAWARKYGRRLAHTALAGRQHLDRMDRSHRALLNAVQAGMRMLTNIGNLMVSCRSRPINQGALRDAVQSHSSLMIGQLCAAEAVLLSDDPAEQQARAEAGVRKILGRGTEFIAVTEADLAVPGGGGM